MVTCVGVSFCSVICALVMAHCMALVMSVVELPMCRNTFPCHGCWYMRVWAPKSVSSGCWEL